MKKRMGFFILPILFLSFGLAFGAARDSETLVIAQGVDAASLDSMGLVDAPSFNVRLNIYDTLLQRDTNLKIEPLLAESYKLIDDLTWEFKLRKKVWKFSTTPERPCWFNDVAPGLWITSLFKKSFCPYKKAWFVPFSSVFEALNA